MKITSNHCPLIPFVLRGEIAQPGQNGNHGDTIVQQGNGNSFFSFRIKRGFLFPKNPQCA